MKRYLVRLAAVFVILAVVFPLGVFAADVPQTASGAVILVDGKTGEVLYGKNENSKMYPASTTKIMVALLALENLELDEVLTVTNSALSLSIPGHTNMALQPQEQLSVRYLLYGLMLKSAGDAANVLGERISGSVDEFVILMNKRALDLGMNNTNYKNATGAHDPNHYTTAYDLAILAREAMKNETFRTIVGTASYEIPATEKFEQRPLKNTNYLISGSKTQSYYYEYATGIKTGFTNEAMSCLVSSAEKNGLELISVALGADNEYGEKKQFTDCINLFEYGFATYELKPVVNPGERIAQAPIKSAKGADNVILEADGELSVRLEKGQELVVIKKGEKPETAPNAVVVEYEQKLNEGIKADVYKGDILGQRFYYIGERLIGEIKLVATKDYVFDPFKSVLDTIKMIFTSPALYITIVLIFVALVIIRQYNYNKKKRQRALARKAQREKEAEQRRAVMRKEEFLNDFLNK